MIRVLYRDQDGELTPDPPVDDLAQALEDPNGLLLVALANGPIEQVKSIVEGYRYSSYVQKDNIGTVASSKNSSS